MWGARFLRLHYRMRRNPLRFESADPSSPLELREEAPDRLAGEGRDGVPAVEFAPRHGMTVVAALVRDARGGHDGHGLALAVIRGDPVVAACLALREGHHSVHVAVRHPDRDLADAGASAKQTRSGAGH